MKHTIVFSPSKIIYLGLMVSFQCNANALRGIGINNGLKFLWCCLFRLMESIDGRRRLDKTLPHDNDDDGNGGGSSDSDNDEEEKNHGDDDDEQI